MAAGRSVLSPIKMLGVGILYWNLLCVLSLLNTEPTMLGFYAGGVFGHSTTVLMTKLIGTGGAWLLLSGLAVTVFIFVAGMELKDIVERSLQGLEERGPDLGQRSLDWGQDVLYSLRERSRDLADSLRERFSKEPVEFDEDDWYGESFMDTGSVFTDDGFGYSEEDSLPPNSFEHSSEYEFHEDEESESLRMTIIRKKSLVMSPRLGFNNERWHKQNYLNLGRVSKMIVLLIQIQCLETRSSSIRSSATQSDETITTTSNEAGF